MVVFFFVVVDDLSCNGGRSFCMSAWCTGLFVIYYRLSSVPVHLKRDLCVGNLCGKLYFAFFIIFIDVFYESVESFPCSPPY